MLGGRVKTLHPAVHGGSCVHGERDVLMLIRLSRDPCA